MPPLLSLAGPTSRRRSAGSLPLSLLSCHRFLAGPGELLQAGLIPYLVVRFDLGKAWSGAASYFGNGCTIGVGMSGRSAGPCDYISSAIPLTVITASDDR